VSETLIYSPSAEHRCDVGWTERSFTISASIDPTVAPQPVTMRGQWDSPGTVRRCDECGQHWVAREIYRPPGGGYSSQRIEWRREGRLGRWWRERRARRLVGENGAISG
jgi:hypothetical protein